jgi:site-specific DNA recombinase
MTVSNAGSETGVSSSGPSSWRRAINFSSDMGTRADPTDRFGFFRAIPTSPQTAIVVALALAVAEAAASVANSASSKDGVEDIRVLAVVEPEGKLIQIQRQIFLAHVVVGAPRSGETTAEILRVSHFAPIKMKRRGLEPRIILDGKDDLPRMTDAALLKAVARARRWFEEIGSGHVRSSAEIAKRERLQRSYVARLMRLAFLSPALVDALAEGRARAMLNLQMLKTRLPALPLCWKDQQQLLG